MRIWYLKYSPFLYLYFYVSSRSQMVTNSFHPRCFPSSMFISSYIHVSLLLSLLLSPQLSFPSLLPSSFSLLFPYSSFSVYIIVLFCLSSCPSIDCMSLSLFCIHVLRHRQKPAMLECMCSRSGADCATAEMSFSSNCILLWSDDTQMLITTSNFFFLTPVPGYSRQRRALKKSPVLCNLS